MKQVVPFIAVLLMLCPIGVFAQCDTVLIPSTAFSVLYTNHNNIDQQVTNIIDGDDQTYWETVNEEGVEYPHEVWIDLGIPYNLSAISYKPRQSNTSNGKLGSYEVYIGFIDTIGGGDIVKAGTITYANGNDNGTKVLYFGSTPGQFVKIVATSGWNNSRYLAMSEFEAYRYTCGTTGKKNQVIQWEAIGKQTTTDGPFPLDATISSTLPITYTVLSGPASISGGQLVLDGTAGLVKVAATQAGDAFTYPADTVFQEFTVIDLTSYDISMNTRLTGATDIEMPSLSIYPISAFATIAEPDYLKITGIDFEVVGETIDTIFRDGTGYTAHWLPSAYGNYTVKITAHANNGKDTTATINVSVVNTAADQVVNTFDHDQISFGNGSSRTIYREYALPQFVGAYDSIHAHLSITCPAGIGCDPYDRGGWIEVLDPSGNWVQIIRYITPFGVGCDHNIDLTEYTWLLQGNTQFRFYIDTWAGAWGATLDLEYYEGTPDYKYNRITEIWDGTYTFGNPSNLQPVDTAQSIFYSQTSAAKLILSNTGHGWGDNNTGNAAEFYHAYHTVKLGDSTYTQDLWNSCDPNPDNCTLQQGTWEFDRAGWCPGAISPPDKYDLTEQIGSSPLEFMYIFQESYVDECHPQNPNCVSGTTCPNCNDGFQPIYYVDGQLVEYSNTPFIAKQPEPEDTTSVKDVFADRDLTLKLYPNPASSVFQLEMSGNVQGPVIVYLQGISGQSFGTYYFNSTTELNNYNFRVDHLASGMYFITANANNIRFDARFVVE